MMYSFHFTPAIKMNMRAVLSIHDGTVEIARALRGTGKTVLHLSECQTLAEIIAPYYPFVADRINATIGAHPAQEPGKGERG